MNKRSGRILATAITLLGLLGLSSCSSKLTSNLLPNQPPTVRLTNAPYDSVGRYYYAVTINWTGYDPDGRISYYLYAVDPPKDFNSDTAWVRTTTNEQTILFAATHPVGSPLPGINSEDPHTFVLKAVDNRGMSSPVVDRAFFSTTIAPVCRITNPPPKLNTLTFVTPSVLITWDGSDVDGVLSKRPVKYKWKLLSDQTEVNVPTAIASRDSVRRYYAARNWAGWDSTSAETTVVQLKNLVPEKEYIFCVIGFDEAGAYSPRFELDTNMLHFRVTFAGNNNPTITFYNSFFLYQYPGGSYEPLNPARIVPLQIPAGRPVTFNWFATAIPGSSMRSYRWALDIQDLDDETERTDQATDLSHWSPKNLDVTSATIGPFPGSSVVHKFYLEAEDINGLKSLGIIGFTAVEPTFDRPLGIIKDTRLATDDKSIATATCPNSPQGRWPTSAELDTFLYARGGFPWKCYPAGTITTTGLFTGYDFDTVGTLNKRIDQTVSLVTLGRYRHLLWLADKTGLNTSNDGNKAAPMSALKYMCYRNRLNTLGVYLSQGGRVWMAGGAAVASTVFNEDLNSVRNDVGGDASGPTLDNATGELIPGRFPYDWNKWQSSIKFALIQPSAFTRGLGRNYNDAFYLNKHLPAALRLHDPAVESFPPNRSGQSQGNFFYNTTYVEYINGNVSNDYQEDLDPGPGENFQSALDTLITGTSAQMVQVTPASGPDPPANVLMTVYPARSMGWSADGPIVVTSGFNLWDFTRDDCQAVVDFVLQDLWGMPKSRPAVAAAARSTTAPPVWSPPGSSVRSRPAGPASVSSLRDVRRPGAKP